MNIEHLKEAANEYVNNNPPQKPYNHWGFKAFIEGAKLGLAHPRTPIDTDKMVENYKEIYEMLEQIYKGYHHGYTNDIKVLLDKAKL